MHQMLPLSHIAQLLVGVHLLRVPTGFVDRPPQHLYVLAQLNIVCILSGWHIFEFLHQTFKEKSPFQRFYRLSIASLL